MALSQTQVRAMRMRSLLLNARGERPDGTRARSVGEVVEWLGAMQAQDVASGEWSLGVRLPDFTLADVHAALEKREALRTWPMRGTVHLVPARDAAWMVDLMSAKPLAGGAARRDHLGITLDLVERSNAALQDALSGGKRMTRAECMAALADAGIAVEGQVSYHLLWYASQKGVTCIAPHVDGEQTFVLLNEWVPDPHRPEREEALEIMAVRFFRSHGPATVADFARWTGLNMRESRAGIAAVGEALEEVDTEAGPMVAAADAADSMPERGGGHLALPGFDEYMLGYGDRSGFASADVMKAVIPGNNGVFQSTLVREGETVGLWKRTLKAKAVAVSARALTRLSAKDRAAFEEALNSFGVFVGKPVQVRWD